jgi:hypothetical protein
MSHITDNKSFEHNLQIINDLIINKKTKITNERQLSLVSLTRTYNEEIVTHLEAIYNLLQIINKRLVKLEETHFT